MSEITGGLIQMNAHMIRLEKYEVIMAFGVVAAIIFAMLAIGMFALSKRWAIGFAVFVLVSVAVVIIAANKPRVKEIHACADGAVSLEMIATKYEIRSVDGKELVLRER